MTTHPVEVLLKGEVLDSSNAKRINNLYVWLGRAHMREVRVGALQGCVTLTVILQNLC